MIVRAHILVRGHVHGVFFRANTAERASMLGLKGWVRNVPNGVEIVVEGEREKIESLIAWCGIGPPEAHVERVEVAWQKPKNEFVKFIIL